MFKKHTYKALFAMLAASLLAGCATETEITMNDVRNMDYGSYPKNYEKTIRQHLARTLIDPNSLMIDGFSKPKKYLEITSRRYNVTTDSYNPAVFLKYYIVCARINAKNTYGGYTGWQDHIYYFRDGKIMNSSEYGLIDGCSDPNDIVIKNSTFSDVKIVDKPEN
ncbi:YgdI/YgdR family lipoprotein [Aggregatibacter aphrophilus]|jgi:raw score 8.21|uniref:YgdI/YgdR family lipoprotein n=1 Tax=Aggregatibacter aphrophilus TaxID=732 RepID=UPI001EF3EBB6|nr:YgdI/YgdR family lipoprotein [Aggregatibacter aphrophilus]